MFFETPLKSHIALSSNPNNLKEYSVILSTSFYDMNEQILTKKEEEEKKKSLFPKFQLIQILPLQVMHDYVH